MSEMTIDKMAQQHDRSSRKVFSIAVFEGDGIGPEIMAPTVDILETIARRSATYDLNFNTLPAGAAHYQSHAESLPQASLDAAGAADAILLSAMGLPSVRYADGTEISPQIELRMKLGLFAGVRPVFIQSPERSPLKGKRAADVDFVIIRESTEGLFASHGKGEMIGDDEARETMVITRAVSEKLFKYAFKLAGQRMQNGRGKGLVHCVDKANVFQAFAFFRKIFFEVAKAHPGIEAECAYVDATALRMVQNPAMFDVLVTENMFGDILSDLGAGIMGSLGLAPSADIGENVAVFQPCHGSAPDIAGKGIANPIAMILSAAMMLEWLGYERGIGEMVSDGESLRDAVSDVLANNGAVTADLGGQASTRDAASAIETAFMARSA